MRRPPTIKISIVSSRWRVAAFSLVEILASLIVLSTAALGITAAWKLADTKALVARLDERATRILRAYYELQTFSPDFLFLDDYSSNDDAELVGHPLKPGSSRLGFLYHPKLSPAESSSASDSFADRFPYTVSVSSDGATLTISYDLPAPFNGVPKTKEIGLGPRKTSP